MRKLITAATLLALSGTAMAHQCDVEFNGELALENGVLTITTDDDKSVVINDNHELYVDGSSVSLSSSQQEWLENYYDGINEAAPAVAEIALDGISIASEAVGHVFGELLGADSYKVDELTVKLDELSEKVHGNFYAEDGSFRIVSTNFENGDVFGEQWEAEFEETIEELVESSIGHLLVSLGSEILFSGGDMEAFEARMEKFGTDIEEKMEFRGEQIEAKADALCLKLVKVDLAENSLQSSVPELSTLNILDVNNDRHSM